MHSNSVFIAESGQPVEPPFDRNFIAKQMNVMEDQSSKKVPLLYSLLFGLKRETYEPTPEANYNQIKSYNNSGTNVNSNKFKEQSLIMNSGGLINIQNQNTSGKDKNYFEKNDQPKPWIID